MVVLLNQGRFAEAIELSDQMIAVFHDQADRRLADTLFYRALAEENQGDIQAAIAFFSRANRTYVDIGMLGPAARAMAAGGRLMLANPENPAQDEGAYLIQQAVCMKLRCDDRGGIGADFVLLSRYALGRSEMSRALGHGRRGLRLSLMQDNRHEIVSAMENLVDVYLACRLYHRAIQATKEAMAWAEEAGDPQEITAAEGMRARIAAAQKVRGKQRKTFICPCETNKARGSTSGGPLELKDCCGPADRDPIEIDFGFCLAPQHGPYRAGPDDVVPMVTLGEYVDKQASGEKPEGFKVAKIHDGWAETFALSDMANYHLKGARAACEAFGGPMDVGFPIAAVLHATCSLEAFLNGLAFIAPELKAGFEDARLAVKSWTDRKDPELITKWITAGSMFCNDDWLEPTLSKSLRELVRLRNSLVHFDPEWEALDEPAKSVPLLSTQHRPKALWWPHGALEGPTGAWAVETAEGVIAAFRLGLREEFRALRASSDLIKVKQS